MQMVKNAVRAIPSLIWNEYVTGQTDKSPINSLLFQPPHPLLHHEDCPSLQRMTIPPPLPSSHSSSVTIVKHVSPEAFYIYHPPPLSNCVLRDQKLLVYFHVNATNIQEAESVLQQQQALLTRQKPHIAWHLLMVEYEGYTRYTANFHKDPEEMARKAFYVIQAMETELEMRPHQVVLFGQSIGTSIATMVATKYLRESTLVLLSPFTSMRDLVNDLFLHVGGYLIRDRMTILAHLSTCQGRKILLMHGEYDRLISISHSERIYQAIQEHNIVKFARLDACHNRFHWTQIACLIADHVCC